MPLSIGYDSVAGAEDMLQETDLGPWRPAPLAESPAECGQFPAAVLGNER